MTVSLDVTGSLYSYNGTLAQLGALTVLPSFPSVSGAIELTDDDGTLTPGESSSLSIDGSTEQLTYEGVATFNSYDGGLVGGLLGTLLGSTEASVFTSASGEVYLYAPDGFPLLGGVANTVTIDNNATFDLVPSTPGAVDGTSGDDVMTVGYTDDEGDEITDYDPGGLLGIGYQSGDDVIYGHSGNDVIYAGSGDDTIYGGSGNDTIHGGAGSDTVYGGEGDDLWLAGDTNSGTDEVFLGDGDDTAEVGYYIPADGNEVIDGGEGNDTVALDARSRQRFRSWAYADR